MLGKIFPTSRRANTGKYRTEFAHIRAHFGGKHGGQIVVKREGHLRRQLRDFRKQRLNRWSDCGSAGSEQLLSRLTSVRSPLHPLFTHDVSHLAYQKPSGIRKYKSNDDGECAFTLDEARGAARPIWKRGSRSITPNGPTRGSAVRDERRCRRSWTASQ